MKKSNWPPVVVEDKKPEKSKEAIYMRNQKIKHIAQLVLIADLVLLIGTTLFIPEFGILRIILCFIWVACAFIAMLFTP